MLSTALAFTGAIVWGAADFFGGLAARRLRPIVVGWMAAASGLVFLAIATPLLGGAPTSADLAWGAASGLFGVLASILLYATLAIGPMSVLSPLTAVVSAVAPLGWALLVDGERLGPLGYTGLVAAVVAAILVAVVPGDAAARPSPRGVLLAIGAGLAIGGLLITMDRAGDDSGLAPLVANRAVNLTLTTVAIGVLVAVGVARGRSRRSALVRAGASGPVGRAWALAAVCGTTDAAANTLTLLALRSGDLSVVSALTALYPAGTVVLAAIVLRERPAAVQWLGLVLAVGAGALLALG